MDSLVLSCFIGLDILDWLVLFYLTVFFLFYWTDFSCFIWLFFLVLLDWFVLIYWTIFSCFIGLSCHVFKALEIQRNLIDKTVGYLISYKDFTAALTVLRCSPVNSVNICLSSVLHVFNLQFCICYKTVSHNFMSIFENCKSHRLVTQIVPVPSQQPI